MPVFEKTAARSVLVASWWHSVIPPLLTAGELEVILMTVPQLLLLSLLVAHPLGAMKVTGPEGGLGCGEDTACRRCAGSCAWTQWALKALSPVSPELRLLGCWVWKTLTVLVFWATGGAGAKSALAKSSNPFEMTLLGGLGWWRCRGRAAVGTNHASDS